MYVCGPTVYDHAHIGHARSYVFYDALKRYLVHSGYRIRHVQNFTDISDRLPLVARKRGSSVVETAEHYLRSFKEDMARLRTLPPDVEPRATEHIGDIIELAKSLIASGQAYCNDAGCFFDAAHSPCFGDLAGRLPPMKPPVDGRKDQRDFAIWRFTEDAGATWDSPWGRGRPGWHIECPAMAIRHLSGRVDLHGGGLDLIYPHHEAGRAAVCAATSKPFCDFYVHNGFVTMGDTKMSKSVGNYVTVRDLLGITDPGTLRYFLLSKKYRDALEYSAEALKAAQARLWELRSAFAVLRTVRGSDGFPTESTGQRPDVAAARSSFIAALDDDFDTPKALSLMHALAGEVAAAVGAGTLGEDDARAAVEFYREADSILVVLEAGQG